MSAEENIPQMRETIERLSQDNAKAEKSISDLNSQLRVRDAREAFRGEGYNPKHGDLYAAVNPEGDITAEAVVSFADEQGLVVLEVNQESSGDSGSDTSGDDVEADKLSNMSGGGSRAGEGGAGGASPDTLTRTQWKELYRTDQAAAQAAITSGRVEISKDDSGSVPGTNPYADMYSGTSE